MCGGGSKKTSTAQPTNMGYTYSQADYSNTQRQKAAIDPETAKTSSYGSELSGSQQTNSGGANVL